MTKAIENNTALLSVETFTHFVAVKEGKTWNLESGWEEKVDAEEQLAELVINQGFSKDTTRVWGKFNALKNVEHNAEVKEETDKEDKEEPLSAEEKKTFKKLDAQISKGLKSYIKVGHALGIIRDDRLYRETHTNFHVFVKENYDLDKALASRMINASKVACIFMGNSLPVPNNLGQARQLLIFLKPAEETGLTIENLTDFWIELTGCKAKETDKQTQKSAAKKLTAKFIEEKRKELYPTKDEIKKAEEKALLETNKAKVETISEDMEKAAAESAKEESETGSAFSPDMSKAQDKIEELQEKLKEKEEEVELLEMGNSSITRQLNDAKKASSLPDHDMMKAVLSAGFKTLANELKDNTEAMKALIQLRSELDKKVKFADFDINSLIQG